LCHDFLYMVKAHAVPFTTTVMAPGCPARTPEVALTILLTWACKAWYYTSRSWLEVPALSPRGTVLKIEGDWLGPLLGSRPMMEECTWQQEQ
jgi:hypothetical protein